MRVGVSNNHFLERVKNMIRTHKRLIATAATLAALAAGLVLCVSLVSSSRPAYALEQTAQANNQIRTCHVRCSGGGVGEAWIEMNSGWHSLSCADWIFRRRKTAPRWSF